MRKIRSAALILVLAASALGAFPASASTAPTAAFAPVGGRDVAAITSGANVVAFSSQHDANHSPQAMLDARAGYWDYPWATALNQITNQFVKIELSGGIAHTIDRVRVQPRPGWADQRVKDFEVWVSTTTADDIEFVKVLTATAADNGDLQEFLLPAGPVAAKYVMYKPLNNRGSCCHISTQRFQALTGAENHRNVGLFEAGAAGQQASDNLAGVRSMIDYDAGGYWLPGWQLTTNQWAKVSLAGGGTFMVDRVQIRTYSYAPYRVKDFQIAISTTDLADTSFTTVLSGTLGDNDLLQEFALPRPTLAKHIKYTAVNNRGGVYMITDQLRVITGQHGASATVAFKDLSTDPENDIVSWSWDFGDGTSSIEQNPIHTYPGPGAYTVGLTVTDALGATNSTSLVHRVLAPPVPNFTFSPVSPNEGQNVVFDDTSVDPDGGPMLIRNWTWGDGGVWNSAPDPAGKAYGDNKTYTVTLQVIDTQEQVAVVSKTVTTLNLPPSVNVFGDRNWVSGQRLSFGTSVWDPGWLDQLTCTWDHGDGTSRSYCWNFDHTYSVPVGSPAQQFTATLTARDDDGAERPDSLNVRVFPQMFNKLPNSPIPSEWGIAWSPVLRKMIATQDNCKNQLVSVELNGTIRYLTPAIAKACGETKIAVSPGTGGFSFGDVVLANGAPGELALVRFGPDGKVSEIRNPWVKIPTVASWARLNGGLTFDTVGSFGGDLLTVWGDGKVFRVKSDGTSSQVANFNRYLTGAAMAPATGFGPASGCLLTTDDWSKRVLGVCAGGTTPTVATLSGASYGLEDLVSVPIAGDLFLLDPDRGAIYQGDSRSFGSALAGHVLVGTRYNGEIWDVRYDEATSSFKSSLYTLGVRESAPMHFEQMMFLSAIASGSSTLTPASSSMKVGKQQTITASIKDSSGNAIPDLDLSFVVTGVNPQTVSAVTDANGIASFTYTGVNAGSDSVIAVAGGAATAPSTILWSLRESRLTADPAIARLDYSGATTYFPNLRATLIEVADGSALAGKSVSFFTTDRTTGASVLVCTGVTDASGVATCGGPPEGMSVAVGGELRAVFEGDAVYIGSEDTAPMVRIKMNLV